MPPPLRLPACRITTRITLHPVFGLLPGSAFTTGLPAHLPDCLLPHATCLPRAFTCNTPIYHLQYLDFWDYWTGYVRLRAFITVTCRYTHALHLVYCACLGLPAWTYWTPFTPRTTPLCLVCAIYPTLYPIAGFLPFAILPQFSGLDYLPDYAPCLVTALRCAFQYHGPAVSCD